MFALRLPLPDYPFVHSLPISEHNAPLVLPWEHSSMDQLFTTKHRRFRRSRQDLPRIQETMESIFHTKLSGRTERRYRRPTSSIPHVDALIRLSVMHLTRYTDALRVQRPMPSDRGRHSLDSLLKATHLADLSGVSLRPDTPVPKDRWMALRKNFVEWPMLLSLRFPQLRALDDRVVLLPEGSVLQDVDPPISPGSLILLDEMPGIAEVQSDITKTGWGRGLYAFRRGADLRCGYLEKNEDGYTLLAGSHDSGETISIRQDEIHQLSSISGIAVPL